MSPKLREELITGVGSLAAAPSAPILVGARSNQSLVTMQDRLDHGNLTIDEVCALKRRSRTGFYADLKAGLVEIEKIGRKSVVRGPVAKRYIAGGSVAA